MTTNNGNIGFSSTVNGAQTLNLTAGTGGVTVSGVVGTSAASASRLASFTVTSAATVALNAVFTTGAQTVTGTAITLNGPTYQATTAAAAIGYTGAVTLGGPVAVTTNNGNIGFSSTVNGAQTLEPDSGDRRGDGERGGGHLGGVGEQAGELHGHECGHGGVERGVHDRCAVGDGDCDHVERADIPGHDGCSSDRLHRCGNAGRACGGDDERREHRLQLDSERCADVEPDSRDWRGHSDRGSGHLGCVCRIGWRASRSRVQPRWR